MSALPHSKAPKDRTHALDCIPSGTNPPFDVNVIVEVPIGGEPIKYELDKASGTMFVDRMLYTSMHYPGNYGFIPHTLSNDGDPIDVLIANSRPIISGAVCNCRPVGVLYMQDEAGGDEKIIAVPSDKVSPIYRKITNYSDLPEMLLSAHCALLQPLQGSRELANGSKSIGGAMRRKRAR